jgi:IclR family pca regulon transcriptional regulator
MATPESESFVRTFARGLTVIEVMGKSRPACNIAEIAEAAALPRSVVRRLLMTLTELGFTRTDGKHYWLTPKVLRLGLSYLYTLPYWRQAQLALEELCADIGQSCAISVLDEEDIVYVVRLHTRRILAISPSWAAGCRRMPCRWAGCCWPGWTSRPWRRIWPTPR